MRPPELRLLGDLLHHPDFESARRDPFFFARGLEGLHSPLCLPDMERAVEFLRAATSGGLPITVVGDRDVDGVTSAALVGSFLIENGDGQFSVDIRVSSAGDDYGSRAIS